MRAVSARQMQKLDELAIRRFGISSLILMENAGRGIADLAAKMTAGPGKCILVIAGKGNNGGDGLVAARHLFNRGFKVRVILLAHSKDIKADPKINFNILKKMRVPVTIMTAPKQLAGFSRLLKHSDLLIDAIFGIGLKRPVSGPLYAVIHAMNDSKRKILAIDIPSGLDSDTGAVLGLAVRARVTGTLHAPKHGLFRGEGPKHCGKIRVLDISIPSLDRGRSF